VESRFTRRRRAARERNTCVVCLHRPAADSLTVCGPCNEDAKVRVRRWRRRKADESAHRKAMLSQEAAGDFARNRHAYPEALGQYGEALRSPALRPDDDCRLSEKYASAIFFGHEPETARHWYERAIELHRSAGITTETADAVGTLLLRLSRQYWLAAQTVRALPLIGEAIQLGTVARDKSFFARANLAMAHYLILLGRHRAAAPFFERAGDIREEDPPEMRAVSCDQRAILFAAQGNREEAYRSFDAAVEAAKQLPDGYQITSVWDDYGIWAMALGDIETAQLCRERALFVARERHIAWRIAYLALRYADLLLELEQYERARELVLEALTFDIETPCIRILTASIGIRLASFLDDRGLLRRCSDDRAMEHAFASGEPARIGPLASAIIRQHLAHGDAIAAQSLLRRSLPAVLSADHAWDLLLDAATAGNKDERQSARDLLSARASAPNGSLAQAYLDLFDAAFAKREGRDSQSRVAAHRAVEGFKCIGWHRQERLASSYLTKSSGPIEAARPSARSFRTMLGDLSVLTKRESEIADLALEGLTNRAIARKLSISEHTVESHMTSIMNRLGIRSRHQLVNVVVDSGKASF
jgi:DNA-binding CsgD family transcriptional regulator/tetratricopeptide (TPR) repeat protein